MNLENRLAAARANLHRYTEEVKRVGGKLRSPQVKDPGYRKALEGELKLWKKKVADTNKVIADLKKKMR